MVWNVCYVVTLPLHSFFRARLLPYAWLLSLCGRAAEATVVAPTTKFTNETLRAAECFNQPLDKSDVSSVKDIDLGHQEGIGQPEGLGLDGPHKERKSGRFFFFFRPNTALARLPMFQCRVFILIFLVQRPTQGLRGQEEEETGQRPTARLQGRGAEEGIRHAQAQAQAR
jgi:hypothetical protein